MLKKLQFFFSDLVEKQFDLHAEKIIRLGIRTERVDALSWLHKQKGRIKTYWSDRENEFEMAGVGVADLIVVDGKIDSQQLFQRLRKHLTREYPHLRYYGGLRFYDPRDDDPSWQGFGGGRFVIPRFEIQNGAEGSTFYCTFLFRKDADHARQLASLTQELETLQFAGDNPSAKIPYPQSRRDTPDQATWAKTIEQALAAIYGGRLEKVVLARKSSFAFATELDPLLLLIRLKTNNPQLFFFGFQIDEYHAFIGGSPERLYKRNGIQLKSEAVAGTRPRGENPADDDRLGLELLHSAKDRREHRFVLDSIKQILDRFSRTVDVDDELSLLKLPRVQHLCCRLQSLLVDGVTDAELLQAIHPTPAVGGNPTANAINEIKKLEPFDRGWYAGPVGWVGYDDAEFAVAIRSGLVVRRELSLFSGAGIVLGSTPDGEWDEIENKISGFLKILMGQ